MIYKGRAREALSLMRSGALDGLSIGFRATRSMTDKSSGARKLLEVDLWEISIVTFPMLTQARVSKVKTAPVSIDDLIGKLARLNYSRAAQAFEAKLSRLSLERRYAPDQPRAPAGSPQGGQWTSGGGTHDQTAFNVDPNVASDAGNPIEPAQSNGRVDLLEEEANGGHAVADHVGKSEEQLRQHTIRSRLRVGPLGAWRDRVGSFPSLTAANKLVNSTLFQNQSLVNEVAIGARDDAVIEAWFSSPTGYESYAPKSSSPVEIRDTWGVRVTIARDRQSAKGFRIRTAFPINAD